MKKAVRKYVVDEGDVQGFEHMLLWMRKHAYTSYANTRHKGRLVKFYWQPQGGRRVLVMAVKFPSYADRLTAEPLLRAAQSPYGARRKREERLRRRAVAENGKQSHQKGPR